MIRRILGGIGLALITFSVLAQPYPDKAIRLVSPFPPGGGTDLLARTVAAKLSAQAKWSVIVENKAGAGGILGLAEISRARKEGYELVVGQKDNLILAPWLTHVTYDSVKDFTPIALLATSPVVLLSASNSSFQTFQDVVTAAKNKPDAVTFGTSGSGSVSHIISELLRLRAGIAMQHVPYKGSSPALTDLLGGHVDVVGASIASASALIAAGKVRALAVTSASRSPSLPDVPTLTELGVKGVEVSVWYGLLGPSGLPPERTALINKEVNEVLKREDVQTVFKDQGLQTQIITPDAFAQLIASEYSEWKTIIAETGVSAN